MQVKQQQLELDMEQQTGSKLEKKYVYALCPWTERVDHCIQELLLTGMGTK